MVDVESEVNKYRNCKDREEIERAIQDYKNLAMQHAKDFTLAGQYNMVAHAGNLRQTSATSAKKSACQQKNRCYKNSQLNKRRASPHRKRMEAKG